MKKVSFCGITGNGMSALAQILKQEGCEVRGSDLNIDNGLDGDGRRAGGQHEVREIHEGGRMPPHARQQLRGHDARHHRGDAAGVDLRPSRPGGGAGGDGHLK